MFWPQFGDGHIKQKDQKREMYSFEMTVIG